MLSNPGPPPRPPGALFWVIHTTARHEQTDVWSEVNSTTFEPRPESFSHSVKAVCVTEWVLYCELSPTSTVEQQRAREREREMNREHTHLLKLKESNV